MPVSKADILFLILARYSLFVNKIILLLKYGLTTQHSEPFPFSLRLLEIKK